MLGERIPRRRTKVCSFDRRATRSYTYQIPKALTETPERATLNLVRDLNEAQLHATGDPEIATRIASYEMAFRMQSSVPSLMDLAGETKETHAMYGTEPNKTSFANNCLMARRLVERGVRFVQLYHRGWDITARQSIMI